MRRCDLVVATGSQANVRAAYRSGTPAFGVGAGNVASIIDETADLADAARKIASSKTFDNATSCSSENSVDHRRRGLRPGAGGAGAPKAAVLLDDDQKRRLQQAMWPDGKLSAQAIGQSATRVAAAAGLDDVAARAPRMLLVREDGVGPDAPVLRREAVARAGGLSRRAISPMPAPSSAASMPSRARATRSACTAGCRNAPCTSG